MTDTESRLREAAERLRTWAHQHAMLRDNGSIPHDALEVLSALGHALDAAAPGLDVERLARAYLFMLANRWIDKSADALFDPTGKTPEDRWRAHSQDVARNLDREYARLAGAGGAGEPHTHDFRGSPPRCTYPGCAARESGEAGD